MYLHYSCMHLVITCNYIIICMPFCYQLEVNTRKVAVTFTAITLTITIL